METSVFIKISELKKGYGVYHKKYGYLQYRGLVKHPYTDVVLLPHQYIFWQPPDKYGKTLSDIILKENSVVELIDKVEDYE